MDVASAPSYLLARAKEAIKKKKSLANFVKGEWRYHLNKTTSRIYRVMWTGDTFKAEYFDTLVWRFIECRTSKGIRDPYEILLLLGYPNVHKTPPNVRGFTVEPVDVIEAHLRMYFPKATEVLKDL